MKSHLKLTVSCLAGIAAAMAARWTLNTLKGEPYDFPDGWFLGVCVGVGLVVGHWRRKKQTELEATPR